MTSQSCPGCRTTKIRPAPHRFQRDRLLAFFRVVPFRCQLCGLRFRALAWNPIPPTQRNYDRVPVLYPVWFHTAVPSTAGHASQGLIDDLSIRGCRIRSNRPLPLGTRLQLEFLPSNHTFPITIDGAVVRSRSKDRIGLRFVALLREEERRIRHIVNLKLPDRK